MKIEDVAHGIRILEFVVANGKDDVSPNVIILVSWAKIVMKEYKRLGINILATYSKQFYRSEARNILIDLAQAYADKMEQAGQKVPK